MTSRSTGRRWAAAVVHYRSYDDLAACLEGLRAQKEPPLRVLVVDADGDPGRRQALAAVHPEVEWDAAPNRGYAGGANRALERLAAPADVDWLLVMNPDVALAPDAARALLAEVAPRGDVALAGGRLLRPEGVLDSAGIRLPRHRRPRDRGSGQPSAGRYERVEEVFGVGGAALWLRASALSDLSVDGELFDEDFFLYHEDTDLCWRAWSLGWRVLYVPAATAVHGRRWRSERRFAIEPSVRRHSFKNHYLQIAKNERAADLLRNLPWLLTWEVLRLGYALLRDPAVLPGYLEAVRLLPRAWHKRRRLAARRRRRERLSLP